MVLVLGLLTAALAGACGGGGGNSTFDGGGGGGSDGSTGGGHDAATPSDGPSLLGDGSSNPIPTGTLAITPDNLKIAVPFGTHAPTVPFQANIGGVSVPASFSIDLGQIGVIDASTGVMTPSGKVGGIANVTATYGGQKATTSVTVTVTMTDNGAPPGLDAGGGGAGGNGGVGGSGPGGQVTPGGQTTLTGTPVADMGLAWLYPYDKTVWPQGLLAPLLQWQPGAVGNYDAIYIHLVEKGFEYKGFFGKPAGAATFVNHPILQAAWDTLSYSNQGDPVSVSIVLSSGGKAYGPLTETWTIAQGTLTGTVYYNSYGTKLATNYCEGSNCFGGATLAIKHGATSPVLVAGKDSPPGDSTGCRVCHSVAALGATLVTQHGDDYSASSAYALTAGNTETPMNPTNDTFVFPGISPDGTFLISNAAPLPSSPAQPTSGLFAIPSGNPIASTGLPAGFGAGLPVFSPDGSHVAFNFFAGTGSDKISLASLDFAAKTNTFSNLQTLDTPKTGRDVFPAFLPTNDAVVFEHEISGEYGTTWHNTRGELWWVDLKTHTAAALTNLNGGTYLPTGGTNHAMDTTLQYEPTVNPVASGGFAWVVFTSRRLYGNVATGDPYVSDPRDGAYSPTSPTTKKLWVAAIDLNAKPGTDPSHPAFYLPAQELLAAGNSRGYWVVDPCEKNGQSCLTGDQCCSGFCEATDSGALVCGTQPPGCSAVGNKCTANTDCCGSTTGIQCIDGFCAQPSPQ